MYDLPLTSRRAGTTVCLARHLPRSHHFFPRCSTSPHCVFQFSRDSHVSPLLIFWVGGGGVLACLPFSFLSTSSLHLATLFNLVLFLSVSFPGLSFLPTVQLFLVFRNSPVAVLNLPQELFQAFSFLCLFPHLPTLSNYEFSSHRFVSSSLPLLSKMSFIL